MVEIAHFEDLKKELIATHNYQPVHKDILIVVKDQLEYVKACIESIQSNTEDFTLYVWDNASQRPTADYLKSINAIYHRSEENLGFIIPNNRLAVMGKSPYLILLNSDTVVRQDWDKAMVAWMQFNSDVALVGYEGGYLNEEAQGCGEAFGYEVDYVAGWSMALSRNTFEEFGLFDEEHLKFAYGEDSDLCLRLKEAGRKVYALHLEFVEHFGNKTIRAISQGRESEFHTTFRVNHDYLKDRWIKKNK
jgi:O-antigen biosynthesis protein